MSGLTVAISDVKPPKDGKKDLIERRVGDPVNFRELNAEDQGQAIFLSGQPVTRDEIKAMLLAANAKYPDETIMWLDSRQETHFFVDGKAYSDYSGENDANAGLSSDEVLSLETDRIARLNSSTDKILLVHKLEKTERGKVPVPDLPFKFDTAQTEQDLVAEIAKKLGIAVEFRKVALTDHGIPSDASVDELIGCAQEAKDNNMVIISHCAGGKGRSSIVGAICMAVKYNGQEIDLDDPIMAVKIGGSSTSLASKTSKSDSEKDSPEIEQQRADLVAAVKKYVGDGRLATTFSEWRSKIKDQVTILHAFGSFTLSSGSGSIGMHTPPHSPLSTPPSSPPTPKKYP